MLKRFLLASALLSALALPAAARSPVHVGGPIGNGMNANQQSGVNSAISTGTIGSNSAAAGGTGGAGGLGGQGGNAAGGASSVTNNIGSGPGGLLGSQPNDVTVRSAPSAFAPPIYGANPCAVGVSGAGSWVAASLGLGAMWEGENCANRDWYRMHVSAGNLRAAKGTACQVESQRRMFREIGEPCPQDMPPAPPQAQYVSQPQAVMTPSTAADPTASATKCRAVRGARPRTEFQAAYLRANCGG